MKTMKKINAFSVGTVYAGCILGAGFVSGQELTQFFGAFGIKGLYGFVLAAVLFFLLGYLILRTAQKSGVTDMDRIVIYKDLPGLRAAVGILEALMVLSVYVIMAAAVGALGRDLCGFPSALCSAVFCVVAALICASGLRGMAHFFSAVVPFLAVLTECVALVAVFQFGKDGFSFPLREHSPLLPHFSLSAAEYVALNIFSSIGLLTPLGERVEKKRTAVIGFLFGSLILALLGGTVLLALGACPDAAEEELPMLAVAARVGLWAEILYAVMLFLAMLGAGLSCLGGVFLYCKSKMPFTKGHSLPLALVLSAVAFAGSLFGFGNLISTVYPVFGCVGILAVLGIICHDISLGRKKRQ